MLSWWASQAKCNAVQCSKQNPTLRVPLVRSQQHRRSTVGFATPSKETSGQKGALYLSDIIKFESEVKDPEQRAEEIIKRAENVLQAAKKVLEADDTPKAPPQPSAPQSNSGRPSDTGGGLAASLGLGSGAPPSSISGSAADPKLPGREGGVPGIGSLTFSKPQPDDQDDLKRKVLSSALDDVRLPAESSSSKSSTSATTSSSSSNKGSGASAAEGKEDKGVAVGGGQRVNLGLPLPEWATSFMGTSSSPSGASPIPTPQLAKAPAPAPKAAPAFKEADFMPAALTLASQADEDARRARVAVLPPLQSIVEMTTAFRPPTRAGMEAEADAPPADAVTEEQLEQHARVMLMADGAGTFADGSTWEKLSGEEFGENGFWHRWWTIKGTSAEGVEWMESWWNTSDWTGLKEMGAEKSGKTEAGAAWKESWSEKMHTGERLEMVITRNAHKWAHTEEGDEWEEKWGEHYTAFGEVDKYADKWAKQGGNVWHERWGEEYNGRGACIKWTDKWAERLLEGGGREQWGDKWREEFGDGKGAKTGETWSQGAGGEWYQRCWGEEHWGTGQVRKYGHSNTGEQWDVVEGMDTYYNPIPHFGFRHAVDHSKELWSVREKPRGDGGDDGFGGLGPGLTDL